MSRATEIDVKEFMKQQLQQKAVPKVSVSDMYITSSEYALLIGMHKTTVRKLLIHGKIEGAIKVGGRWRIPVKD